MSRTDLENQALTIGRAAKIVLAVAGLASWCGVCIGGYYQIRADQQLTAARVERLEKRQDESEKAAQGLTRAVDRATVIMERLDKKLGQP